MRRGNRNPRCGPRRDASLPPPRQFPLFTGKWGCAANGHVAPTARSVVPKPHDGALRSALMVRLANTWHASGKRWAWARASGWAQPGTPSRGSVCRSTPRGCCRICGTQGATNSRCVGDDWATVDDKDGGENIGGRLVEDRWKMRMDMKRRKRLPRRSKLLPWGIRLVSTSDRYKL